MNNVIKTFLIVALLQISLLARDINLNKLINTANKEKKHLFVWLHKTDCGYCERMSQFTLNDEVVKDKINKDFIYTHINVNKDTIVKYEDFIGSAKEFAIYIGNDFYPTSLFFDDEGELVHEVVGYTDESSFKKVLENISLKLYK